MATYTRLIMSGTKFLEYVKELQVKYSIDCYVEYRYSLRKEYRKINTTDTNSSNIFNDDYRCFFLCHKEVSLETEDIDFYGDDLVSDTIECFGGRENDKEIERLELRIISKKPNDNIRLFSNALNTKLKKDLDIGRGLTIGKYFNKEIFYSKKIVKVIWESFERKKFLTPIIMPY